MKRLINNHFFLVGVSLLLVGGIFYLGYYTGSTKNLGVASITELSNKDVGRPEQVDFSLFWEAWNTLNNKYVGSSTPSDMEKVWGAIQGLASSYEDPYTTFFPPEEAKSFEESVSGNFEGVGMEIGIRDGVLVVVAPLKNTPAFRAGIKAGDRILKIDGEEASRLPVDKAVKLIRGEKGTVVKLTIEREGSGVIEIPVVRDRIEIPTVDTELRNDGVFVLRLYNFSALSPGLFRQGLREFVESGSNKLVIDLRNNPGGYLEASVDMASWFLPAGKVVVQEDFGKSRDPEYYRSKGYDVFNESLKLIILVNGGSASASEILAGALSDHGKATIVGEKTFGKGSVQELVKLRGDTSIKVTIARWLTPNGTSISEDGLIPDVEVKISEEDAEKLIDTQLEKAVEILLKQ